MIRHFSNIFSDKPEPEGCGDCWTKKVVWVRSKLGSNSVKKKKKKNRKSFSRKMEWKWGKKEMKNQDKW